MLFYNKTYNHQNILICIFNAFSERIILGNLNEIQVVDTFTINNNEYGFIFRVWLIFLRVMNAALRRSIKIFH